MTRSTHLDGAADPVLARVREVRDAPSSPATPYSIAVGDTFEGELGRAGDRDWVAVTLREGQTYLIDLTGSTLSDPYLRLHDDAGREIAFNDDIVLSEIVNSRIFFTAQETGTYYVSAGGYQDNFTGDYTIEVARWAAGSLNDLATYLTNGYWEDNGLTARAFDTSAGNVLTVNLSALTGAGRTLARQALEAWEMVADLDFRVVGGRADITFDDDEEGAFETDVVMNGVTQSAEVNISAAWLRDFGTEIDSYSFSTYVHEIGHALGLGHQGPYNGDAEFPTDAEFRNDSWAVSVMSYFDQDGNTTTRAGYAALGTAMIADIVAIQRLYGAADGGETAGATVWGQGSTLDNYLGDFFRDLARGRIGEPVALTIYDEGGVDTLDLGFDRANQVIDLRAAGVSSFLGTAGNLVIARGTLIERLVAGSGNDAITGNDAGNLIRGGAGRDVVRAGAGADSVTGGAGDDRLVGERGGDVLDGGRGDDVLNGGHGADAFVYRAGADRVVGFADDADALRLDDALWRGDLSARQVVARFADVVGGNVVLDFGDGKRLVVEGLTRANALLDDLVIV